MPHKDPEALEQHRQKMGAYYTHLGAYVAAPPQAQIKFKNLQDPQRATVEFKGTDGTVSSLPVSEALRLGQEAHKKRMEQTNQSFAANKEAVQSVPRAQTQVARPTPSPRSTTS